MRNIVSSLFISLDGVTEAPDQWQFEHFDSDMMTELQSQLDAMDTVLLGRVTYEEWAAYWPTSTDEPFAGFINAIPKYVVSTTLQTATWNNTTLINKNIEEELRNLKQKPGKNISISGSPTLVRSLLEQNLLDQLQLTIHPVVAGKGKRLFKDGSDLKRLKLVDSKTTETGVLIATYQPK